MNSTPVPVNIPAIRWLTCVMFLMFAMTTDAVGSIIPLVLDEYDLKLTAAGAFHYAPMIAIAAGALLLGFLADRLGRKWTIILGLAIYGVSSILFAVGNKFAIFVMLLAGAGLGISIFKIGALALVGDISSSSKEHTSLMNRVEGFFGVGAILGPAIVATLITAGMSWKWLYVLAASICGLLMLTAAFVQYPPMLAPATESVNIKRTLRLAMDRYALGFSALIALYVAVEVAIYVWMPTYLLGYQGSHSWLPVYALTIFFVLRALGRFVAAWILELVEWSAALMLMSLGILVCFLAALMGGPDVGAVSLPISGLFMSAIYPTLNSKGISCYHKDAHGSVAGIILFFTAAAAAAGPFAMAVVSDAYGDTRYGFMLATGFAGLLFAGLALNLLLRPAHGRLRAIESPDGALPAGRTASSGSGLGGGSAKLP